MNKISRTLKKMFGKKVYVDISTTQSGNLLRDKCVVITGGSEGLEQLLPASVLVKGQEF